MQPTDDINAWREANKAGREAILQLSSGLRIHVKKAALLELVQAGAIPLPLANQVAALYERGITQLDKTTLDKVEPVINTIVKTMAVRPKIADQPDDEHIGIKEIEWDDRLAMYGWAQRGVAPFRSFPVKSGEQAHSPGD